MGEDDITVVIPSIPPRWRMLGRAVSSASRQLRPPKAIEIEIDKRREGAPATRQRALDRVVTPWVAFLDDDDQFMPFHLRDLFAHAQNTGADYVYSWFRAVAPNGEVLPVDPIFPETHFTNEFDPANPIETTIVTLVRTELAKSVGFHALDRGHDANTGEDYNFTLGCVAAGATIRHLVKHTWFWHHDSQNTSGRPDRW